MRRIVLAALFVLVALFLSTPRPAFAQAKTSKTLVLPDPFCLNPSTPGCSGIGGVGSLGGGGSSTALAPADLQTLWGKIVGAAQADLVYAKALADNVGSPGSKLRSACYAALILANKQANGLDLVDASGTPMTIPEPHVITSVEQAAELVDNLSATAPLSATCAPAANALSQNVTQFIGAILSGVAVKTIIPLP